MAEKMQQKTHFFNRLFKLDIFFEVRKIQMSQKWLKECNRKRFFFIVCPNLSYFLRLKKCKCINYQNNNLLT